jgi:hypothetical protein
MALPILDGNQTATTLATTVSGSAHYPNHIIASGTVTANAGGDFGSSIENVYDVGNVTKKIAVQLYDDNGSAVGVTNNPLPIYGAVTANLGLLGGVAGGVQLVAYDDELGEYFAVAVPNSGNCYIPTQIIGGSVTIGSALPTGTNRIGVVTIGAGTVTIGAGTAQIGSVTASGTVTANIGGIASSVTLPVRLFAEKFGEAPSGQDTLLVCNSSGMLLVDANSGGSSVLGFDGNAFVQVKQVSGSSVTIGNSVTISSLPALVAGTAQIGSVTASISNTAVTVYPAQGTTVTNSNFTSLTSSTSLVSAVVGREVLTVFNEGAGNLHISPGATCTTISYQVRLSAGDYWECPQGQLSLAHTAVFATAGTARITEVS